MEFGLLGPIRVRRDGVEVVITATRQRDVLTALLLHANQVVSVESLIDWLWGHAPPQTARVTLQNYVRRLRCALGDRDQPSVVLTRHPGYVVKVEPDELDIRRFDTVVARARDHVVRGDSGAAATLFREALGLWRGSAVTGLSAEMSRRAEVSRLAELRLDVIQECAEAELALAWHPSLVDELTPLVEEHPLRERLRVLLMRALHGTGRRADALATYRDGHRVLADELGVEPGAELVDLHQAILRDDPVTGPAPRRSPGGLLASAAAAPPRTALTARAAEAETPTTARASSAVLPPAEVPDRSPAQLPPDVPEFVGRVAETTQIRELLVPSPCRRHGVMATAVIYGAGGIGKTAIAVHAAHGLAETFPDGQLYADLHGAGDRNCDPATVLGRFIGALGVHGSAVPDAVEERSELYRDLLSARRVLVVLDNARDESQVRPLLPWSPRCAAIVTSRRRLSSLDATHLGLGVLTTDESLDLLARVAGRRTLAEPDAARAIVAHCGDLPLAVRVAGARIAARPHWPLQRLADRLSDAQRRLDELTAGDLEVRASVALSYAELDAPQRRALRLLGLLDAPDFSAWAAAALLDAPTGQVEDILDELVEAQLLEVSWDAASGRARYRFHDLIQVYARERAYRDDPPDIRRDAVGRALAGWLALARDAEDRLPTASIDSHRLRPELPWREVRTATQLVGEPFAWFEAERPALVAAVDQAGASDLPDIAWNLANATADYFEMRASFDDWHRTHKVGLRAAQQSGDDRGVAVMLNELGSLHHNQDRYRAARSYFLRAALAYRRTGDRPGELHARHFAATADRLLGRLDAALEAEQQILGAFVEVGDVSGRARVLQHIGHGRAERGQHELAAASFARALSLFESIEDRRGETLVLAGLGAARGATGKPGAVDLAERAIELAASFGYHRGLTYALCCHAELLLEAGRLAEATASLDRCLVVARRLGDRRSIAPALMVDGRRRGLDGDRAAAVECL
jgi:DNA-binding SARP family transcriptional activator/tetratricopeptide (TPR) repeat protein